MPEISAWTRLVYWYFCQNAGIESSFHHGDTESRRKPKTKLNTEDTEDTEGTEEMWDFILHRRIDRFRQCLLRLLKPASPRCPPCSMALLGFLRGSVSPW